MFCSYLLSVPRDVKPIPVSLIQALRNKKYENIRAEKNTIIKRNENKETEN